MANRRKRNVIPLNIIQRRGQKHTVSKELVNVTIDSAPLSRLPGLPHVDSGNTTTEPPASEYLPDQDQLGDQTGAHQASESSQHTKRQLIQSEKWKEYIPSAYRAVVEEESMKTDTVCMNCGAPGNVRCHQCGPCAVFCSDCGVNFHTRCNYHHFPEKWKVCALTSCSTCPLGSLVA